MIEKKSFVRRPSLRGLHLAILNIFLYICRSNKDKKTSPPDISAKDFSSRGHFGMCNFWLRRHSGTWTFCLLGHFGKGTFQQMLQHMAITTQEYYSKLTFRHLAKFWNGKIIHWHWIFQKTSGDQQGVRQLCVPDGVKVR